MADWYLNRALTNWRNAVNAAYPNRDKTSDGTIGDAAHQASTSDHNPDADGSVDAWDMDVDLRSGRDAQAIEELKQVFQKHPAARYWIHNRQIAHRNNGWKREYYSGANAHDKHVHWNSEPGYENSSLPWVIKEDDLDSTQDARLKTIETRVNYLYDLMSHWRGGVPEMDYNKTSIEPVKWQMRLEAEQKATRDRDALVAQELADLKAAVAAIRPAETPVVTDEQLERVLRKVIGSVDGAA